MGRKVGGKGGSTAGRLQWLPLYSCQCCITAKHVGHTVGESGQVGRGLGGQTNMCVWGVALREVMDLLVWLWGCREEDDAAGSVNALH